MSMEIALDISGNGNFPGFFAFSARRLEIISSSPVEIKERTRDFQMSSISTPTGDGLRWTSPAGPGRRGVEAATRSGRNTVQREIGIRDAERARNAVI